MPSYGCAAAVGGGYGRGVQGDGSSEDVYTMAQESLTCYSLYNSFL